MIKHNIFLGPQRTREPWKLPAMCTGWVALREIAELFLHKVALPPQHTHTHVQDRGLMMLEGKQGCGSGWGEGLTSPLGHEWVHIHEESQELERDLEPGLFPREQNHHHHLDHKYVHPSPECQKEHILYNLLGPKPTSPLPLGSYDSLDHSPRLRGITWFILQCVFKDSKTFLEVHEITRATPHPHSHKRQTQTPSQVF